MKTTQVLIIKNNFMINKLIKYRLSFSQKLKKIGKNKQPLKITLAIRNKKKFILKIKT